jgi:hypothetical protein
MAPAQPASFGLSLAAGFSTDDPSKPQLVVMTSAESTRVLRAIRASISNA